jgi:hypothetical protein
VVSFTPQPLYHRKKSMGETWWLNKKKKYYKKLYFTGLNVHEIHVFVTNAVPYMTHEWHCFLVSSSLYLLTPWCRIIFEKLIVTELIKKHPSFFISTVFTKTRHGTLA